MQRTSVRKTVSAAVALALAANGILVPAAGAAEHSRTPIEHVIIIIGENHTYDNVFATYTPRHGQKTRNLLSEGIVNADGTPGPNFAAAAQQQASDTRIFQLEPRLTGPYAVLPQPHIGAISGMLAIPDPRFPADLPNGPFQITGTKSTGMNVPYDVPYTVAYDDFLQSPLTGDPPHRFFQMWQQMDGGRNDLFTWVTQTTGIGPQNSPAPIVTGSSVYTGIGGEAMGFYNMAAGDVPQFKALADQYAMADNYHQSIMGGTGANFLAIATADTAYYTGPDGKAATPPANQIENADPQPGFNNYYTQDGYGGGSYVNCSDASEGGVHAIQHFLKSLDYKPFNNGNCAPGHFYLVNNYNLGYTPDGSVNPLVNAAGAPLTVLPPQNIPTIADALSAKNVSWRWYSGNRPGAGDVDPILRHAGNGAMQYDGYCGICDPFIAFTQISTDPVKHANLQGLSGFDADLLKAEKDVPAVMFVRPFESKAGHPLNATMADFEGYVSGVIAKVQANPALWAKTAILVTTDEGGGYYDSGYVQTIDFFGDGTRIPMIAVSPFAKKGYVDHTYYDHASIAKFIERNWNLKPLSNRSRDNLPNPVQRDGDEGRDAYVPANRPAVGDLMNLFSFKD